MEVIWSNPSAQAGPPRVYSTPMYQFAIIVFIVQNVGVLLYIQCFLVTFGKLPLSITSKHT